MRVNQEGWMWETQNLKAIKCRGRNKAAGPLPAIAGLSPLCIYLYFHQITGLKQLGASTGATIPPQPGHLQQDPHLEFRG